MKLLEALESGACGVSFTLPKGSVVRASEREAVAFTEDRAGLQWLVHFGDVALDLAPERDALLARDVDAAARAIFRATERNLDALVKQGKLSKSAPDARVSDPSWSPVVDVRPVTLSSASALQIIHRSAYRPGMEAVMGHLLVPTAHGVVEFRVTATDRASSGRERAIGDAAGETAAEAQRRFDDPALDAEYPKHCLSRVRAALAALAAPGRVEVLRAPLVPTVGEVRLDDFGGSLTLPPRFALAGDASKDIALFTRMSLANTDGVWRLAFARQDADGVSRHRALRRRVETFIAERFGIDDLSTAKVDLSHAEDGSARLRICFEANGAVNALASVWWLHPDGGLRGLQLSAPADASLEETLALFDPAAASWTLAPA